MARRSPITYLDTDLFVIGGGVAGCMGAIAGNEAGLDVLVCDKGRLLERAGSVGGGVDHFLTVMETGPEWDTPEFLLRHVPELTDGIVDLEVTDRVIRETPAVLRKLEGLGVDFTDPTTGTYFRHRSFGLPGTYHLNFDGSRFKHTIGQAARKGGSKFLPRTQAVQIFVRDGRACGAMAFNFRSGEVYAVRARAVLVTTGDVNRISRNASGVAFESWHLPYNTGDGHAMAFRAGAPLVNMEFVEATLTPKGFSTQGLNALCGMGAYFLNRRGERFMERYDPRGERARRAVLTDAVINEVLLGNGPIYADVRHLPPGQLDRMEATLQVDRHTLPAFYRQKGVDFRRDLIEISVSELSVRRSGLYFRGSGLVVDVRGQTAIPGLFAAGDCASVSGGISGAASLGTIAGRGASAWASRKEPLPELDPGQVEALADRVFAPLGREEGFTFRALEDEIRQIVTDHVGYRRTEEGLREGLQALRRLKGRQERLMADDLHQLARCHESASIRLVAEIMATAALARRESRTGSAHRRVDHPTRDDEKWLKFLIAERSNGDVAIREQPVTRPPAESLERAVREAPDTPRAEGGDRD